MVGGRQPAIGSEILTRTGKLALPRTAEGGCPRKRGVLFLANTDRFDALKVQIVSQTC